MFTYILAFIIAFSIYNEVRFFFIKKRIKKSPEIRKGMEPFLLKGGKDGVLMIHGFSSSPFECRKLAKYLNRKGYTVYAPLLTGHGTSPEHLAVSKWHQWISDAQNGLSLLDKMCDNIWIIGNSMGGNVAISIPEKSQKVKGLVCMSTPIRFKMKFMLFRYIVPLLRRIKIFQKKFYSKRYMEKLKKFRKKTYQIIPLSSLAHLQKMIKFSAKRIKDITLPLLVVQARPDLYLDEKGAEYLYLNSQSPVKQLLWVDRSYHNIIADEKIGKIKLFKEILGFLRKTR